MANKEAAAIAKLIGEDGSSYEAEAVKIKAAINKTLWLPKQGTYAEFKDLLGNKMLHKNPAVWTIYHSLDSEVPDAFQAYQSMEYVDDKIPHIPVRAKGLEDNGRGGADPRPNADGFNTISTSKWMPYDWSLNNVATAEVMHTALAYWQAGRSDKAFNLFKSELLSTMYLGGSPGNIGQISFYDAARGEAYRDFADPVAMTARSLVEGLFGICPNALKGELTIKPGFPTEWKNASITTPDIAFDFKRNGKEDVYKIVPIFSKAMRLKLLLQANGTGVKSLLVNGKKVSWKNVEEAIGWPMIEVKIEALKKYEVKIIWEGKLLVATVSDTISVNGYFHKDLLQGTVIKIFDPQHVLSNVEISNVGVKGRVRNETGKHTLFLQSTIGQLKWWQCWDIDVRKSVEVISMNIQPKNAINFNLFNYTATKADGFIFVNDADSFPKTWMYIPPQSSSKDIVLTSQFIVPGTNNIQLNFGGEHRDWTVENQNITNWNIAALNLKTEPTNLAPFFNDKVTNIFKNQYLSPRPTMATLQLPTQGIGDWTHPLKTADINDNGLRKLAGDKNEITLPQGIVFKTPSDTTKPNIIFTSQWDNYPKEISIPLTGKASHAYFMMAGSTNPMQSRFVNGAVIVSYTDGTGDTLLLKNPETWWPIEQDYMDDGYAFQINAARPPRVHLKTGKIVSDMDGSSKQYNGKMIDGGAATVLDLPLNKNKTLKDLKLQTIANDVVIGLMSVSLVR